MHPCLARQERVGGTGVPMCAVVLKGTQVGVTSNYSVQLIQCLQEPQGNTSWNKHTVFLPVDESSQPGSGVTGLSDGPCCVSLKVYEQRETPEGACMDFRPYQLEPFHPKNCNCGGCVCPMEERTHFGCELAVVLILLIVLSTFCTWAVRWAT